MARYLPDSPTMQFNTIKSGVGKPLLLIHGLGGSHKSWQTIAGALAKEREVIAIDLPGSGETSPLDGPVDIATLCDALTAYLQENDLVGVDVVGSSMGARLVLELARRGAQSGEPVVGAVVSLDPGGFWSKTQVKFFYNSVKISVKLVRLLQPMMPFLTGNPITRTLLLAQFSAAPWKLSPQVALDEMRTFASSPSFDEILSNLAFGESQRGAAKGSIQKPLAIGWGRRDYVCFPSQSRRALSLFPDAKLHWFEACGHFPQWDAPDETVQLILETTA